MIFTHINVDLDAAISTVTYCILQRIPIDAQNIQFVPANQQEFPPDAVLIDMELTKHTGPSHLNQFRDYLPIDIVDEINTLDSQGFDFGNLQLVLIALKKAHKSDLQICQWLQPVVEGWMQIAQERIKGERLYESLPKVKIGDYLFLILDNVNIPATVGFFAAEHGISGVVYLSGYNMGITRYPRLTVPDYRKLPLPRGWYCDHRSGFLFARGTRKSPAKTFPPQFQSLENFIKWLQEKFVQYKL